MDGEEVGWPNQLARKYGGATGPVALNVTLSVINQTGASFEMGAARQEPNGDISLKIIAKQFEDRIAGSIELRIGT